MPISAEAFISDIDTLVSSPDICIRINDLLNDPTSSALDIASEIARDPALTSNILRIANSPYYKFPSRIDSLSRAISVIGTQDLVQLVIASAMIKSFSTHPATGFDLDAFWKHSVFVGMLARELGKSSSVRVLHKDRLFVAGILHDIGHLVMQVKIPELIKVMYSFAERNEDNFEVIEKVIFDLGHDEVGAALARKWHFPSSLEAVIRNQFHPQSGDEFSLETAIIHISNAYTVLSGLPGIPVEHNATVMPEAWIITGLDEEKVFRALNDVKQEFSTVFSAFVPKAVKSA